MTFLPPVGSTHSPIAFDTGPGNALIDWYTSILTNEAQKFDDNGKLARSGKVDERLLKEMLSLPYFSAHLPKTSGRELFSVTLGEKWLALAKELGVSGVDFLATLTELTAASIAKAYLSYVPPNVRIEEVFVSGGGSHNSYLLERISELLGNVKVKNHSDLGIDRSLPLLLFLLSLT